MADAMELLEHQYARVRDRDGVEFWRELPRFYATITAGPRPLVIALAELRAEADERERDFHAADDALIPELVELRDELVALAPEADDSATPRPPDPSMGWNYSLANFDQLASAGPDRLVENIDDDPSASGTMLRILQSKLNELRHPPQEPGARGQGGPRQLGPEFEELAWRLRNAADRHQHDASKYRQALRHGGFQVQVLHTGIEQLNPPPREVHTEEDRHEWIEGVLVRSMVGWPAVEAVLAGHPYTSDISRLQVEVLTEKMKTAADAVYEDLRFKVANAPPTYRQRLAAWSSSSFFVLLAAPCAASFVAAVAKDHAFEASVFAALVAVFALVPPILGSLPKLTLNAPLVVGAVVAGAVVLVLFLTVGFAAALIAAVAAALVLGTVFALGQQSRV